MVNNKESGEKNVSVLARIEELLRFHDCAFTVIDHAPIDGSSAGSSKISGTKPEQGAKSLILMAKINQQRMPIMVVIRGSDSVDIKALKLALGSRDIRMATPNEVKTITQLEVGILPPIGSLFGLSIYVDELLVNEPEIAFGTGERTKTVIMKTADFISTTKPVVGLFSKK